MKKHKGNKQLHYRKIAIACIAMLLILLPIHALAGFGDYNDYGGGGDYGGGDYGGGDYGGGYSSYDSGWGSDSSVYSGGSSREGDSTITVLVIAFILAMLGILRAIIHETKLRKSGEVSDTTSRTSSVPGVRSTKVLPNRAGEILPLIQRKDPNFTEDAFIAYVKRVYLDIQDAWCKRDLKPVQGILHEDLYQRTDIQVQKKIEEGIVNYLERICVNTAYLTGYRTDSCYEYLIVYLSAQMIDYQVQEATGKVIYGDKYTRWSLNYKMTFMRSIDATTPSSTDGEKTLVCPNCGAPLKGTSFGQCPYCDSVVTVDKHDWVLSDFGVVRDNTVDEGIRVLQR